jgi:hypothetical protein
MEESPAYKKAVSAVFALGDLTNALEAAGHPWRRSLVMWVGSILIRHVMLPLSPYLHPSEAKAER